MGLRIVTWNVNGIRNPFSYEPWRSKRSFEAMFDLLEADIVIFQETKIQRKDLRDDMVLVAGWDCFFSLPSKEKGKFGVVIYTRQSVCCPIRAEEGLSGTLRSPNSSIPFLELSEEKQIGGYPTPDQLRNAPDAPDIAADFDQLDSEGRCVILEFPAFVLFGVYAPATRDAQRSPFKTAYMNMLDARIRNLVRLGKRVILTGDLNVSKEALDVANIEVELRKSNETLQDYFGTATRRMFNHLVIGGNTYGVPDQGREDQVLWDVCRGFHPQRGGMFTHWETKINARPANYGSRIDYILCSEEMKDWFSDSNIQEGLHGSDHCPVYAVMKEVVSINGEERNLLDVMNPAGMFGGGQRLRPHASKDVLPLSGRLIPDFTGRQSIRDMFSRKSSLRQSSSTAQAPVDTPKPTIVGARNDDMTSTVGAESSTTASFESENAESSQSGGILSSGHTQKGAAVSGKRPSTDKPSGTRPMKKNRSGAGAAGATSPVKGQSQISGFFKPKAPKPGASEISAASSDSGATPPSLSTSATYAATFKHLNPSESLAKVDLNKEYDALHDQEQSVGAKSESGGVPANSKLPPLDMDPAREMEESREGWAKLFSKPQIPLCEHGERCKQMLSKKQGPNYLRSFYMCARPLGPSGDKETGTQWRCRTFVWTK